MTAHDRRMTALRGIPTRVRGRRRSPSGTARVAAMDARSYPPGPAIAASFRSRGDDREGLALALEATAGTHPARLITAGWCDRDIMSNRLVIPTALIDTPAGEGGHLDNILARTHNHLTERTTGYAVVSREVSWWVAGRDTNPDYFPQGWVRLDPADVTALHADPRDWFTRLWPYNTGQLLCQVAGLCVPLPGAVAA